MTRIVTHRLGIPHELIADLSNAEEVSHRVWIREGSHMAHRPLKDLEITVQCGMRVVAIRRERSWMIDEIDGDLVLLPGDVLFLRGAPAGIARLHELAAAPTWDPPPVAVAGRADRPGPGGRRAGGDEEHLRGGRRAGLLGAGAPRRGLAAEVRHLAERLDEMKDHLQLWVLRAAKDDVDPSPLRGLLQLASAAEELGDQANQMVWLITDDRGFHPIVKLALGEADVVATQVPVAARSVADGRSLAELQLDIEPGFHVLAIRRDNRYLYRPRGCGRAGRGRRADRLGSPGGPRPPGRALRLVGHRGRGRPQRRVRAGAARRRTLSPTRPEGFPHPPRRLDRCW